MQLTNAITVDASPDEVFALINDVERVVSCVPGASLRERDGDTYEGDVTVKVGPITAAYSGTIRFIEVDTAARTLRAQGRGADTHGNGDAEVEIGLSVEADGAGSVLRIDADLVIRGKIAQFGKGAISMVTDRLLKQFGRNLAGLLAQDATPPSAARAASAPATAPAGAPRNTVPAAADSAELDGLGLVLGPAARYLPYVGAFAFGVFQGWLLGRLSAQSKHLKSLREARRG
ncbi:SRPBCC family protein [Spiractinospora alimapuensis]|uniref:SRPBCC family protein n=1 Tax=Spiractinospora alimapuensis TaxID=2820884 RepID=UPI001F26A8FC|nr:SRPBCC family protein [Spiractinospora alimapuensis]QVQ54511.1 SRPBCC family protein [Spiractinospora alimapuensis]